MGGRGAFLPPRAARKHDDQKLTLCRTRGVHLPQPLVGAVEEESQRVAARSPACKQNGFFQPPISEQIKIVSLLAAHQSL